MTYSLRTVRVPCHSFHVYQIAAELLALKLGAEAPSASDLICFELSQRDSQMIADDALENLHLIQPRTTVWEISDSES